MCGRAVDPAVLQFHLGIEARIARILKSNHPEWAQDAGACPECIAQAMQQASNERSQSSLHEELVLPFPVYSRDETRIIPTPVRLHANPQYSGERVTIAFLDSGFYPHRDLTRPTNRILCYVDATGNQPVEKISFSQPHISSWHGMMTSCVAAGNGFMSEGLYRGIANCANVVLVKTGNRRGRRIHDKDIQRALAWVIKNQHRYNIRIVNLSLGGDAPRLNSPLTKEGRRALGELDELVEEAVARGMIVVAASGNGGIERIIPPASAPSAITVGGLDDQNSLDRRHHRMYHSNYGRGVNTLKPEVTAPAIWLAAPMLPKTSVHNEAQFLWRLERASDEELARLLQSEDAQARISQKTMREGTAEVHHAIRRRMVEQKFIHPHYQHVDGTSFAAPIVSSVVAQMLEANPRLSPAQVKQILVATANPLDNVPFERQGYGVVNPARAVAAALREPGGALEGMPFSPCLIARGISFYYFDKNARTVALVGRFNNWNPRGFQMRAPSTGIWQITIPQPAPGVYSYKFLIDNSRWTNDPENSSTVEDGYGGFNSLLAVSG